MSTCCPYLHLSHLIQERTVLVSTSIAGAREYQWSDENAAIIETVGPVMRHKASDPAALRKELCSVPAATYKLLSAIHGSPDLQYLTSTLSSPSVHLNVSLSKPGGGNVTFTVPASVPASGLAPQICASPTSNFSGTGNLKSSYHGDPNVDQSGACFTCTMLCL